MDKDLPLIRKMRQGDADALEAFVERHYANILRYCRAHTDDPMHAEDCAQETFVRFFSALPAYRHYGKAANFLYVIAANACRDVFRQRRETPLEQLPETAAADTGQLDTRLTVRAALSRLPDEVRETAILYFISEQKQADIARILGIGLPLVKYRVRRAREILSKELEGL